MFYAKSHGTATLRVIGQVNIEYGRRGVRESWWGVRKKKMKRLWIMARCVKPLGEEGEVGGCE